MFSATCSAVVPAGNSWTEPSGRLIDMEFVIRGPGWTTPAAAAEYSQIPRRVRAPQALVGPLSPTGSGAFGSRKLGARKSSVVKVAGFVLLLGELSLACTPGPWEGRCKTADENPVVGLALHSQARSALVPGCCSDSSPEGWWATWVRVA